MIPSRTFYDVLNVGRHARKGEIKEAYRKLALRRHPDKDLGNPYATAEFQELYEAYFTLHDENRRILYDKKFHDEHTFLPRNTGYGENQQANKPPGQNTPGRHSPTSETEDDYDWNERMRTAGEAHERAEKMKSAKEARDRADRRAKKGKEEWDRRNWYEYRPPSKESRDEEDDEGSREAHEHRERTRRDREACDRAYTQAKDTEERGWLTELQARFKNLLRLRKKIEAMEANIENMEHEDADILESERRFRNRTSYRTSIWDQIIENEEMEQARRRAEWLQARTSETIKLSWAEKELKHCENEHRRILSLQSQQRREQAGRVEATLTATSEHIAQQEAEQKRARENEISGRLAREKEERCRDGEARQRQVEREHKERESVRKETRKADLRETQKDEAVRRQRI